MFTFMDTFIIWTVILVGCFIMNVLLTKTPTPDKDVICAELLQELIFIEEENWGEKLPPNVVDLIEQFVIKQVNLNPHDMSVKAQRLRELREAV